MKTVPRLWQDTLRGVDLFFSRMPHPLGNRVKTTIARFGEFTEFHTTGFIHSTSKILYKVTLYSICDFIYARQWECDLLIFNRGTNLVPPNTYAARVIHDSRNDLTVRINDVKNMNQPYSIVIIILNLVSTHYIILTYNIFWWLWC